MSRCPFCNNHHEGQPGRGCPRGSTIDLEVVWGSFDHLKHRIAIMREGILEARREGCACDFHLYGEDTDLDKPETLDRYCTMEQNQNRIAAECYDKDLEIARLREVLAGTVAELLEVIKSAERGKVHHDGDEFHERLTAAQKALGGGGGA